MIMAETATNTKRIAKNTVVLYLRMIVVMLITLYTSRILLKALGVDDFGLFNVVGGVIGLLMFFTRTMEKSTQRFLNVSMVDGGDALSGIFASSITIHILFALLFLLVGETAGLWFLNAKVFVPESRQFAANIVFQASLLSVCASFLSIPYSAAVIAYERMSFLAIISIVDAVLKLCIALFLLTNEGDRLIFYGILLLGIQIVNFLLYYFYCRKKNKLLKFRISFDKNNFKKIFSYSSWTLVGQAAVMGCNHGNVVLVNMFHSLVANAAMSVGTQVNAAVTNLTTNFQTAFNPQITKSYAEKNFGYLAKLVSSTTKISFSIMIAVALPIAFNIDWVLKFWLDEVPKYSNSFTILFMVNGILNAISMPFNFVVLSSGRIRIFQIATAVVFLSDLPVTYFLFKAGLPPITVLWVKISVMCVMLFVRVYFSSKIIIYFSVHSVCKCILLPIAIAAIVPVLLAFSLNNYATTIGLRIAFTVPIEIVSILMLWFVCFAKEERQTVLSMLKNIRNKVK